MGQQVSDLVNDIPYDLPASLAETGFYAHRAHDVPLEHFQVLGERGSGTNFVRKLISKNLALARTEGLGWKHAAPHSVAIPRSTLVVCVFRDARAWSLSMHKRPWAGHPRLQALSFSDFIRAPWEGIVDRPADFEEIHPEMQVQDCVLQFDRHPITGLPYENLFALRTGKMEPLIGMTNRDCNVVLVRFETIMADPALFLANMRTAFNLAPHSRVKDGVVRLPSRRMGNNFNNTMNDRPQTPVSVPDSDIDYLRNTVHQPLESLLGYDY